jgi:hypothetical protein
MKKICLIIALLLTPLALVGQTPTAVITGTAVGIGQTLTLPVTLQVQLVGCGQDVARVIPSGSIITNFQSVVAPSPTFIATATVYGNDVITCGGQSYSTYVVTWNINGRPAAPSKVYRVVQGQTCNISDGTCQSIGFTPPQINNATGFLCPTGQNLQGFNAQFVPQCVLAPPAGPIGPQGPAGTPGGAQVAAGITTLLKGTGTSNQTAAAIAGTDYPGFGSANTFTALQTLTNGLTVSAGTVTIPGGYTKTAPTAIQNIVQPGVTSLGVNTLNNTFYASQWCTTLGTLDQTCLTNAVTAASTNNLTVEINSVIPITSSVTVPTNVSIRVVGSGGFAVSNTGTLIIGGAFEAPMRQVFSGAGLSSVYFQGSNSNISVLPQWFGATGNSKAAGFTSTAGNATITLRPLSMNNWVTGDVVTLAGAGVSGANLTATLAVTGGVITSSPIPSTTVGSGGNPMYTQDDSPALNAWANSVRGNMVTGSFYDNRSGFGPAKLYMPKGEYQVCTTPVLIYASTVLESEESNTNTGASFSQCNPSISVLKISANNFDPSGVPHNFGSGNSYFKHVQIRGDWNAGSITRFPTIQYLNSANLHSDNRWDHPMFESINGPGFGLGFQTTGVGSISAGATTMTIADASTFCNATFAASISQPCNQLIIVGAGTAGANLAVTITMTTGGGGGTLPGVPLPGNPAGASYSVTFSPAIITAVTNPVIYPARDIIGALTIEHAEMDGGQYFLTASGNVSGNFTVMDSEIFNANNGAFLSTSLQPLSMNLNNILCQGCGDAQAGGLVGTAINWVDPSNAKTNVINIRNSQFLPLMMGGVEEGGTIQIIGANSIAITNNRFYNLDIVGTNKAIYMQNAFDMHVSDNQFYWDTTFNSWTSANLIEINDSNSLVPAATITNNSFVNNSSTTFPLGIAPDIALTNAVITGNNFRGTGAYGTLYNTSVTSANIRNTFATQNFVMKQSTVIPTVTGVVGDIVWNSNPGHASPMGWIYSSGAWLPLANVP